MKKVTKKTKRCKCLIEVVNAMKKKNGITDDDQFEYEGIGFTMAGFYKTFTSFKWRKGDKKGKWNSQLIVHNYCPFCGKPTGIK